MPRWWQALTVAWISASWIAVGLLWGSALAATATVSGLVWAKAAIKKAEIEKEFEDNQRKVDSYYRNLKQREEIKGKYTNYIIAVEKSQNQDEILYNSLKFIEAIIQDDSFTSRNLDKIQ